MAVMAMALRLRRMMALRVRGGRMMTMSRRWGRVMARGGRLMAMARAAVRRGLMLAVRAGRMVGVGIIRVSRSRVLGRVVRSRRFSARRVFGMVLGEAPIHGLAGSVVFALSRLGMKRLQLW
jgi:hypothetical protein